jgi:hypothetical protein
MSMLAAIQESVTTTATRRFDGPLEMTLPLDEWAQLVAETLQAEHARPGPVDTDGAMERLRLPQEPFHVSIWTPFGEVRVRPEGSGGEG